jgi:uncharacterized protein (UPF0332 family)
MSFDWGDYYTLATQWRDQAKDAPLQEALTRSAISRAYYAAFCLARNFLKDQTKWASTGTPDDHEAVRREFARMPDQDSRQVAEYLKRLRMYRNQADYDDQIHSITNLTTVAFNQARQIIRQLELLNRKS